MAAAFGWVSVLGLGSPESIEPVVDALIAQLFDHRVSAARRAALADAMASLSAPWTGELVARLASPDDDDRAIAARALAAPRHLEAVPELLRSLEDLRAGAHVRAAAAHALGAIGDASVTAMLAIAIDDPEPEVRHAAVVALRALDATRRSAPAFLYACSDVHVEVRCAALAALLIVGGPEACSAARVALVDAEAAARALAVVVLARHGTLKDSVLIGRLATDDDARVRRAAREALTVLVA